MNPLSKDLNLLIALRALLEEANVTRAGDRLAVGQSAMSTSLGRLRRHYKDELLVRVGREYELTPLAKVLLPQVRRTVPLIERALGQVGEFDPAADRRTIRILLSDFAAMELRVNFRRVLAAAPGVQFDLRPLPETADQHQPDMGAADFVVIAPGAGFEGESQVLFTDHYVCVVDRHNPRLRNGRLSWSDLCEMPHARAHFGRTHRPPAQRRLEELGLHVRPKVVTRGLLPLPAIVAGTDLVTVVPSRLAARLCPLTGTVAVPTPFDRVELIEAMWWHPERDLEPSHRWFLEHFLDADTASQPVMSGIGTKHFSVIASRR